MLTKNRRRFSFPVAGYKLPHTGDKRQHAKRIITYGIKNNRSPKDVLKSLKDKGLGYRKTDFLADYSKGHSTEFSRDTAAYKRANLFHKAVLNLRDREFLKGKTKRKITYSKASEKLLEYKKATNTGTITPEMMKELEKLTEREDLFGESP